MTMEISEKLKQLLQKAQEYEKEYIKITAKAGKASSLWSSNFCGV